MKPICELTTSTPAFTIKVGEYSVKYLLTGIGRSGHVAATAKCFAERRTFWYEEFQAILKAAF